MKITNILKISLILLACLILGYSMGNYSKRTGYEEGFNAGKNAVFEEIERQLKEKGWTRNND